MTYFFRSFETKIKRFWEKKKEFIIVSIFLGILSFSNIFENLSDFENFVNIFNENFFRIFLIFLFIVLSKVGRLKWDTSCKVS